MPSSVQQQARLCSGLPGLQVQSLMEGAKRPKSGPVQKTLRGEDAGPVPRLLQELAHHGELMSGPSSSVDEAVGSQEVGTK